MDNAITGWRPNVKDRIENDFRRHKLDEAGAAHCDMIREACLTTARLVEGLVPDGRERSTALTKLEEVMFHANAGIARQSDAVDGPFGLSHWITHPSDEAGNKGPGNDEGQV